MMALTIDSQAKPLPAPPWKRLVAIGAVATNGLDTSSGGFYVSSTVGNAAHEYADVTADLIEFNQPAYCHCTIRGHVVTPAAAISKEEADGLWAFVTPRNAIRATFSGSSLIADGWVLLEGMKG